MSVFEDLYNSTIKIVSEVRGDDKVKGGSLDLNHDVNNKKVSNIGNTTEYGKIDPINVYRNKVSLKNVPYDVNKVKFLYNKQSPGSESYTSFINKAQQNNNYEKRYYRNFVRWLDENARRSLWENHGATGVQRVKYGNKISGIDTLDVYELYDFDHKIVFHYAYYLDGKYHVVLSSRAPSGGDNFNTTFVNNIIQLHKKSDHKKYFKSFTTEEFYNDYKAREIFLDPKKYDIVDREEIEWGNSNNTNAHEILLKLYNSSDPSKPLLLAPATKRAFEAYCATMNTNSTPVDPNNPNNPDVEQDKKKERE